MSKRKDITNEENFRNYWDSKHQDSHYQHADLSPIFEKMLSELIQQTDGYILDHGCGGGRISVRIAKQRKVSLCDISSVAVRSSLERLAENHLEHMVHWSFVGSILKWNDTKNWGGVCSHRVIHAIPSPIREKTIESLISGLKKSGKLLLTAKSINCHRVQFLKDDPKFEAIDNDSTFLRNNPFRYIHYFSHDELKDLLEGNRLRILYSDEFDEETGNLLRDQNVAANRYWLFFAEKI